MLDLPNFHRLPFAWIPLETTNVLHWLWHSGNQSQFHISHLPQLVNAQCHSHFFECYNLSHSPTDVGLLVLSTGRSVVGGLFIKWICTSDVWSNADLPQQLQRAWLLLQHLIVLCFEIFKSIHQITSYDKEVVIMRRNELWRSKVTPYDGFHVIGTDRRDELLWLTPAYSEEQPSSKEIHYALSNILCFNDTVLLYSRVCSVSWGN